MVRREHVAVRVVFQLIPVWIQPVIEYLATQHVPADSPEVLPALEFQVLGALPYAVDVQGLVGAVHQSRCQVLHQHHRVVVRGYIPPVQAHECQHRAAV